MAYSQPDMPRFKKELILAAIFVGCGLLLLPPAVYWVGAQVVGEYANDGGVWTLMVNVWSDLIHGSLLAWILVLSPYLIVQSLRLARGVGRRKEL